MPQLRKQVITQFLATSPSSLPSAPHIRPVKSHALEERLTLTHRLMSISRKNASCS